MKRSDFITFLQNVTVMKTMQDELRSIVEKYIKNGLPSDLTIEPIETLFDEIVLEICGGTTKDLKNLLMSHEIAIESMYGTEVENDEQLPGDPERRED